MSSNRDKKTLINIDDQEINDQKKAIRRMKELGMPMDKDKLLKLMIPKPWFVPVSLYGSWCKIKGGNSLYSLYSTIQNL